MSASCNEKKSCPRKDQLRKLFTEHAVYTKFYIESALEALPDLSAITARLLQNQDDIANYLKPYIGVNKAAQLADLLKAHILAAAKVVAAAKEGDKAKLDEAVAGLFANSALVARLLSTFNPEVLTYDSVLCMFNSHNQYVIDMTTLHLQHKYEDELKVYDIYYAEILSMSDSIKKALCAKGDCDCNGMGLLGFLIFIVIAVVVIMVFLYFFNCNRPLLGQVRKYPDGNFIPYDSAVAPYPRGAPSNSFTSFKWLSMPAVTY